MDLDRLVALRIPLYYGEDISLTIRYRNYWIDPVTNTPVLEAANFHDVFTITFEELIGSGLAAGVIGLIAIIVGSVGISLLGLSAGIMMGVALTVAKTELDMAYERAWVNDWGIRTVTRVHYVYPWTILGYLTSWVAQYLVWFDGTVREWLPNSYVTGIIFTGIGVNALILSGVEAMILAEGIKNSWIPWYPGSGLAHTKFHNIPLNFLLLVQRGEKVWLTNPIVRVWRFGEIYETRRLCFL